MKELTTKTFKKFQQVELNKEASKKVKGGTETTETIIIVDLIES